MNSKTDFSSSYNLRHVIFCGAVASVSAIFSVLFIVFLKSRFTNPDWPPITNTVSEMMGYAELFAFIFGSYFTVSLIVFGWRNMLLGYVPPWFPISAGGSLLYCFSFFTRVWIEVKWTYAPDNPFAQPPPTYGAAIVSILISSGILMVVTGMFTALASNAYENRKPPAELDLG